MISLDFLDIVIIILFFTIVPLIGFLVPRSQQKNEEDYLLSGRKVGLFLFVTTTVSTWYGGILGVGEFSYRYGLVSWFTQGLPYYIFAILFAIFFAKKVRSASLFTIPEKLEQTYGKQVGLISALIIFFLISPAPYLLMIGSLISLLFDIHFGYGMVIGFVISSIYLLKGGFKANLWVDVFQFFVMFIGFILIVFIAADNFGTIEYLEKEIPESHFDLTGGFSPIYLIVWFLIALWTFADPGFHQRCYSAKTGNTAMWGIIISVIIWIGFDFLTTTTGLYSRAVLHDIDNPVLAYPLLAEVILSPGLKGIYYAALFATIFSTLNSFLFLSATTLSKDFATKILPYNISSVRYTQIGILLSGFIGIIIALIIPSVIELWYTIGSLLIPAIILLIIGSYYSKYEVNNSIAKYEMIFAVISGLFWMILRDNSLLTNLLIEIEPMIVGLLTAVIIHSYGIWKKQKVMNL
ncbi:putative sodium-solute symporter [hydrocarbon metagenome]|uniref:Putative sodium-solute symporter n=1 Tax=hydrocarbon metagenome TaxID=938273 RepID=A0A0W8FYK9_9ZZZZ